MSLNNTEYGWHSPYQDTRFNEAAGVAGFNTAVLKADGGQPIFFHGSERLTAWEISPNLGCSFLDHSDNYQIYQLHSEIDEARPSPDDYNETDYYTLVLDQNDLRFTNRFMRNVNKASGSLYGLVEAETNPQINTAIKSIEPYPERYGKIEIDRFASLIKALARTGILKCFVLKKPSSKTLAGTSFVLLNEEQANLRYYSAARESNAGHLLHYKVINHLFEELSVHIVDQSGVSPPQEIDPVLRGITEFKRQVGGRVLRFSQIKVGKY